MTTFTLGVRLQSGSGSVQVIFEDVSGAKAKVYLNGAGTTEQFYRIVKSQLSAINWTKVRNIVITLEESRLTQKIGTVEVRFGNNYYVPYIAGIPYTSSTPLSTFGTYNLPLGSGAGNTNAGEPDAEMIMKRLSKTEFEYEYDLSPSNSCFAFAVVKKSSGTFDITANDKFVFAAMGSEGERVRVEMTDSGGRKASFVVLLSSVYQKFVLDLTPGNGYMPAAFDKSSVKEVTFVQDRNIGSPSLNDFVKIQMNSLYLPSDSLPVNMAEIQSTLVTKGLGYFDTTAGLDPVTHFPYDNVTRGVGDKRTQPTLIGYYLQILGDIVRGSIVNNTMSKAQALAEIKYILSGSSGTGGLLGVQATYGANCGGLIPWLDLGPLGAHETKAGLGDNANLAQSMAVMVGALESAGLTGADLAAAQAITAQVDQFLNNQAAGYAALVNPVSGRFYGEVNTTTGQPITTYEIDRLASEFRGAVAFLAVRFPSLPRTVWDNLVIVENDNYVARDGRNIANLAAWDGGAFQTFWPSLRNNERDFIGFRNALYNQLVTQLDHAYRNRIPGILSAAQDSNGAYQPNVGIPQISEHNMIYPNNIVMDLGSTYALASAMNVDIYAVLGWLDSIDYLYGMNGTYGFFDSARSASEIAPGYIGIDVASTILGLKGQGGADFQIYLRNRSLEANYNTLYDQKSRLLANITRTSTTSPAAPEFPDRSLAVFSHIAEEGKINNFQTAVTQPYGVRLVYTNLAGADSGHFWKFGQVYDAKANQLILRYSAVDSPQSVRIELKDGATPANLLYQTTVTLQQGAEFARLVIDLPDLAALANVKELDLVVDPDQGGDATGDFTIHAIDFQHVPSGQSLMSLSVPGAESGSSNTSAAVGLQETVSPQNLTSVTNVPAAGTATPAAVDSQASSSQPGSDTSNGGTAVPSIAEPQAATTQPTLMPVSGISAEDVTPLPEPVVAQLVTSSPDTTTLKLLSPQVFQMSFNLKEPNAFANLVLNFDPKGNGSTADLSKLSPLVFGLDSTKARVVKITIKDAKGKRATRYVRNVDVTRNYYKFLVRELDPAEVDVAKVVEINLGVDASSVNPGDEIGDIRFEIGSPH
jgi:hypothetical protein